jgi:hypothetical protein
MIHLHDKTFEPFISSDEIAFAIKNMAKQMDDDFFDEVPGFGCSQWFVYVIIRFDETIPWYV